MSYRHSVCQVADRAYRGVGVDHLQQPALLERFSMIQRRSKRLKAARLKLRRIIVDLVDDVISGLGEGFLGIVGYDQTPKAARETNVINRPVRLSEFGDKRS